MCEYACVPAYARRCECVPSCCLYVRMSARFARALSLAVCACVCVCVRRRVYVSLTKDMRVKVRSRVHECAFACVVCMRACCVRV